MTQRVNVLRGTGFAAVQAKITRCPAGHPYDDVNTYRRGDGSRDCKTCRSEALRASDARRSRIFSPMPIAERRIPQQRKTHCPSGHPYAGDNLYVDSRGNGQCRTCRREAGRRQYLKRQQPGR